MRNSALLLSLLIGCTSDQITKTINDAPTVAITSHSDGFEVFEGETLSFRAQASDTNNGTQAITVAWYLGQEVVCDWATPLVAGDSFCEITFDEINTVVVEVRDEEGAAGRDEITGNITANAAPEIEILSPTEIGRYYSDQLITFQIQVSDAEDNPEDLVVEWESSLDGILTFESQPDSNGSIDDAGYLSEGQHSFDVRLTDTMGKSVTQSLVLDVGGENTAPTCEIIEPENHATYSLGETVFFTGLIQDSEASPDELQVQWSSDKDGDLGTGSASSSGEVYLSTSELSADTHTITFSGVDDVGENCSDVIFLTVGTAPIITLNSPSNGDVFQTGESINFSALVTDDDELSNQLSLSWVSDLDGELSSQSSDSNGNTSFTRTNLSAGNHSITLTVTDTSGLTTTNTFNLLVNTVPTAPNLTIAPSAAQTDDNLLVTATGSTDDDGDTITYSYQWYQNGLLTSNATMSIGASQTTKGDIWTARVTPNDGNHDGSYSEVSMIIENTAPLLSNTAINPNSPSSSELLTCSVTATDADGDSLNTTYTWSNETTGQALSSNVTFQLTPSNASVNDTIKCTVAVSDADDTATASALTNISNTVPVISSVSISGTSEIGEQLSCSVVGADGDGDSLSTIYSWTINGQVVGTNSTITLDSSFASPTDTIECSATITDPSGDSDSDSSSTQIQNQIPVFNSLSLSETSINNGETIECLASVSDEDNEIPTLVYSWENATTGSALGTNYSLTLIPSTATSQDLIVCTVTATDGYGGSITDTVSFTVENTAPIFTIPATITPNTGVTTSDSLTCSGLAIDSDGLLPTLAYSWVNTTTGSSLGSSFSVTLNTSTSAPADVITCTITATDSDGETETSVAVVSVENSVPVISSMTLSPDPAYTNDGLTATTVASDSDGDSLSFEYAWSVDGTFVQAGSSNVLSSSLFLRDNLVTVSVQAFDGIDFSAPAVGSITVSNTLPTTPVISLSPSVPLEGIDALVCTVDSVSSDIDGDSISYGFSWTVDSAPYSNATDTSLNSTVAGTETFAGEEWICSVTPNDGTDDGISTDTSVIIDSDWAGLLEFTNCGQTGRIGPSQSSCDSEYSGTTLDGLVTITSGIQYWSVPATGVYTIEAVGAGESNASGASIQGDISLTAGEVLKIVVAQMGETSGGGHGGTFVALDDNTPLVVAGGGAGYTSCSNSSTHATANTTANNGNLGYGGSAGDGGHATEYYLYGGGGAGGFYTDGTENSNYSGKGIAFVNGAQGGDYRLSANKLGGFGGGGAGISGDEPSGGGGYSGGGGGGASNNGSIGGSCRYGGGGGSYNLGSNQSNISPYNIGHGYVIINKL